MKYLRGFAARAALAYAIVATLWILTSDYLVRGIELTSGVDLQTVKGLAFVFTTAIVFYLSARRWVDGAVAERLAKRLGESEARFRALVWEGPIPIFIVKRDGLWVEDINPAGCEVFGYTRDEMIGTTIHEHSLLPHKEIEERADLATKGQIFSDVMRTKNGDEIRLEIRGIDTRPGGEALIAAMFIDVTERERAWERLEKEAATFSEAFESSRIAIGIMDTSGVFSYANPALRSVFGNDIVGMRPEKRSELFHPDDRAKELAALEAVKNSEPVEFTARICVGGEECRWWRLVGSPVVSAYGNEPSLLAIVTDIHEAVLRRQQVEDAYQKLVAAFETLDIGVFLSDTDGELTYMNPQLRGAFDFPDDWKDIGLQGFGVQHIHPDDRDEATSAYAAALSSESPLDYTARHVMPDGTQRWLRIVTTPYDDPSSGEHAGRIGVTIDVTNEMARLDEIEAAYAQIISSFDSMGVTVFVLNPDGSLSYINPAGAGLYDLSEEDMVGHPIADVLGRLVHPEDLGRVTEISSRALADQAPLTYDARFLLKSGEYRWMSLVTTPIVDPVSGEFLGAFGMSYDINESMLKREELTALVEQRTEELLAATEARAAFLANMSHELRTPLNSIIGFSGILGQGLAGPLNDEQDEQVRMIKAAGDHLLTLVNDILDLSKIDSGEHDLEATEVGLGTLMDELVDLMAPMFSERGLELAIKVEVGAFSLRTDERALKQILVNLLSNAAKFTVEGGATLSATLESSEWLQLTVADTGPGMGPDELAVVFDEFRQLRPRKKGVPKGTGLGLPISRRLTRLLGGDITAQSQLGEGSVFTVRIPTQLPEPEQSDADGAPPESPAAPRIPTTASAGPSLSDDDRRFEELFAHAPSAVALIRDSRLECANQHFLDIVGASAVTEVLGLSVAALIAPEDREEVADRSRRRHAGEPVPSSYDTTALRLDGSHVRVHLDVITMDFPEGRASVAILTDLTAVDESRDRLS